MSLCPQRGQVGGGGAGALGKSLAPAANDDHATQIEEDCCGAPANQAQPLVFPQLLHL